MPIVYIAPGEDRRLLQEGLAWIARTRRHDAKIETLSKKSRRLKTPVFDPDNVVLQAGLEELEARLQDLLGIV